MDRMSLLGASTRGRASHGIVRDPRSPIVRMPSGLSRTLCPRHAVATTSVTSASQGRSMTSSDVVAVPASAERRYEPTVAED